jgi:hypothetical protein
MELRRLAVGATVLAALGVCVIGCQPSQQTFRAPVFASHDSPIDVGGGSIYGSVGRANLNSWTSFNDFKLYGSRSSNSDYIKVAGFAGLSSPTIIQNTGGWLITIVTKDSGGAPLPQPSIAFCSNIPNTAPYSCLGTSLNNDRGVYVAITSLTAKWDLKPDLPNVFKHKVMFDDVRPECSGTESACDEIYSITITTVNQLTTTGMSGTPTADGRYTYGPYTCQVNKNCSIEAGQ